ncbi:hypothetical protein KKA77_01910 [Patescibacteria group bacterium]|nr:hypothetical protein [Patescibacteria group bacterium]MBU0880189.1 hypothetical protein [Patescibacteria group bacterium]MBU1783319.1 hypothetical protein [Patescibacteria group bacterium]MBU2081213.1 hypothetical protein [Patescibacteria group bacterium]
MILNVPKKEEKNMAESMGIGFGITSMSLMTLALFFEEEENSSCYGIFDNPVIIIVTKTYALMFIVFLSVGLLTNLEKFLDGMCYTMMIMLFLGFVLNVSRFLYLITKNKTQFFRLEEE